VWLVIVGVIATVVSIYYYLYVLRAMYMQGPEVRLAPMGGSPPRDWALTGTVAAALVIAVGSFVAADPLLDTVRDAVSFLEFPR
jgi:NADH:ubiquinone oxidoreductase subunit 2 (subunit N)